MSENKPKILAISGSLRDNSSNTTILKVISKILGDKAIVDIYDGLGTLPFFSPEIDTENPLPAVKLFREKLKTSDGIIICTPEYAFGVPGVLKNALDWTVSSAEFTKKPTALITASSVGEKGHQALQYTLQAIDADVQQNTLLLIPFIRTKINSAGEITDPSTLKAVTDVATALLKMLTDK